MPIPNLTIIGETINDSVPLTKKLFDAGDIEAFWRLPEPGRKRGRLYRRERRAASGEFMAEMVRKIQAVTAKPLSIDTPDPALAEAGLRAYDPAAGRRPKADPQFHQRAPRGHVRPVQAPPFQADLAGLRERWSTAARSLATRPRRHIDAARHLVETFLARCAGATNDDCILDPGIAPLGSDSEGNIHRLVAAMERIHQDPFFAGCHASVGLSNFTVMLPPKRPDGSPVKGPLESAFLTKVMPLGLDMVIGSVKRNYELLAPDHPAMQCLEDCLNRKGFDVLMRVREFYTT